MDLNIETAVQQPPSLIKYQPPIDITQKVDSYRKAVTPQLPNDSKLSNQDILNIMLPPRNWRNSRNQQYMQYVSHSKPERQDVQLVQKKLDQSLLKMQARFEGMCPIKQYLFSQVFDQIVRQVTLDCPQRGLMLMRVRDQRKMTISAYQTVYEEGISYGLKKQVQSSEGIDQLHAQLQATQTKLAELQKKKKLLQSKKRSMEQKFLQRGAVESQKREYQRNALIAQNKYLESFLQKTIKPEPQANQQPQQEEI